ncbi:dienelactone hydrolase family protein [Caballeronia sp. dw_19]|uniref:dienelactone hydrolase family protein n=1 Tax=Caballeronia sp. dw_19 TaxID=2719791 RepID=UPI001BD54336|nr:dienelactone hydrolase family protein [Caballeronia sp. dw_19]
MSKQIHLQADDGHAFQAWCAAPDSPPRGAVVIVQEVFGVNQHIRQVCERFAGEGYLAVAPALYDRVERDCELPYGPEGVARGIAIRKQISDALALRDLAAAIAYVGEQRGVAESGVGVIGFCWGGTLAWLAATRLAGIDAAVCYYGTGIAGYVSEQPGVPVMLHFGEQDKNIPAADVELIESRHPDLEVFRYPAGHGFNCDDRPAYDAASASQAMARTLRLLSETLG